MCLAFYDESTLLVSVNRKLRKFALGSMKFIQEYPGRVHCYFDSFAMANDRSGLRMRIYIYSVNFVFDICLQKK